MYPQKLALTSPTSGGRSVGIVHSRTQATEFKFFFILEAIWHIFFPFCRAVKTPKGCSGFSIFNVLINVLDVINHTVFSLMTNYYLTINPPSGRLFFQSDADYAHKWCSENFISLISVKPESPLLSGKLKFWTRYRSWLRHYATSRKAVGSIPD
jgi:hypothetical protein